jgi:hypothetical protein
MKTIPTHVTDHALQRLQERGLVASQVNELRPEDRVWHALPEGQELQLRSSDLVATWSRHRNGWVLVTAWRRRGQHQATPQVRRKVRQGRKARRRRRGEG